MKIKRALILCIIGLLVWLAWGSRANVEEDIEETEQETPDINTERNLGKCRGKNKEGCTEIIEEITTDSAEPSNVAADRIALYVSARELWEPEDQNGFYYAWSDIDDSGQPELVVLRQVDEEDSYEIHFYIMEEGKGIQELNRVGSVEIRPDSLPTGNVYQDYSSGRQRHVFSTQSSCYRVHNCSYYSAGWIYQADENSLPIAAQWEILTAENVIWKSVGTQSGRLSDEALREELETSYAAYQSSTANRDVQKITDRFQSVQEYGEEENALAVRQFIEKVEQGDPTWEIFTRYTKEHDPIPIYVDYNGEDFYGIWDESATPYAVSECPYHGFRYQYMKTFLSPGEDGCARRTIILTNKEDLSPQDLDGNYGKVGEYPDYLILYGDVDTDDPLCRATDIVETERGDFVKRNGVYLIEDGEQLELLSKMIADGEEIEPGVDAAAAFYRLRNDVEVSDCLLIGSMKSPFYGSFLGDGYMITGVDFGISEGGSYSRDEHVRFDWSWRKAWAGGTIENEETFKEIWEELMTVPSESISIDVRTEGLDMQLIAECVQECWDRNHYKNHYTVHIDNLNVSENHPNQWAQDSDALLPFLDLFGEEVGAIMRQTAEAEDSYVSFLRLERIDGLDICSFAVRVNEEEQYHVMVRGEWEDVEIPFQHLVIPSTGCHKFDGHFYGELSGYGILQADINFDGRQDLLIQEGYTSGSGGSFVDYRAVVWDEEKGEFVWYPSFPEMASDLELNEKRVIKSYMIGVPYQVISEYSIVDGEYVKTRELILEYHVATNTSTLSYYEMGILVKEHDVTSMSADEVEALYPDLDFWRKG